MEFGGILMSYSEEGLVLLVKKLAPYQFIPGKTLILPHYIQKRWSLAIFFKFQLVPDTKLGGPQEIFPNFS